MSPPNNKVTSGIAHLDALLGGGIIIGDNVVWYDDAGRLASVFALNLIRASFSQKKPVIYICFDHSPKILVEKLGALAENRFLTLLDCFTNGKGEGSDIFQQFYRRPKNEKLCPIIKVDEPRDMDHVSGVFYGLHKTMSGDVRFIFDSLTGMQELWGDEEQILKFYAHSCPRLYELNTIAYWIVEKKAHTQRLKAHINKITQVAVDLSLKRGKTTLTVLKADKRNMDIINKPTDYWYKGLDITFETEENASGKIHLGARLKELRTKRGLSQTELAKMVGVTPSTISQIESNQIYPSLPGLFKMSEILSTEVGSLFQDPPSVADSVVFSSQKAVDVRLHGSAKEKIEMKLLTSVGFDSKIEPYLISIPPRTKLSSHFFVHKGEETGYLLSGKLSLKMGSGCYTVNEGDTIYLKDEIPRQWENKTKDTARLLWMKIK